MKSINQKVVLTITVMVLEGCWLYMLMQLMNVLLAKGRLNIPGLLSLYLLAFGTNRLMHWFGWRRVFRIAFNIIGGAIFTLLMLKIQMFGHLPFADPAWLKALGQAFMGIFYGFAPELLLLAGGGVLWWFGRRMAFLPMEFATTVWEFQFGLIVLLILLSIASGFGIQLSHTILVVLLFFSAVLLSLSVARAQVDKPSIDLYGGNWLGILLMSIGLILLLGLIIGSIITPDLLQLAVTGLKWLVGIIVKGITFIVSLFPEPNIAPPEQLPGTMTMPTQEPDYSKLFIIPEAIRSGLRFGWDMLMIGLLLFFIWRVSEQIFVWLRGKFGASANAEFESLSGAFWIDIQSLLRRILKWILKWRLLPKRQKIAEPKEIISVRQLYRYLLHWAATGYRPKLTSQTAYEYLDLLQEKLPAYGDTLQYITEKYVSARYGHITPSVEEMDQLKRNWHLIKHQHLK